MFDRSHNLTVGARLEERQDHRVVEAVALIEHVGIHPMRMNLKDVLEPEKSGRGLLDLVCQAVVRKLVVGELENPARVVLRLRC